MTNRSKKGGERRVRERTKESETRRRRHLKREYVAVVGEVRFETRRKIIRDRRYRRSESSYVATTRKETFKFNLR